MLKFIICVRSLVCVCACACASLCACVVIRVYTFATVILTSALISTLVQLQPKQVEIIIDKA